MKITGFEELYKRLDKIANSQVKLNRFVAQQGVKYYAVKRLKTRLKTQDGYKVAGAVVERLKASVKYITIRSMRHTLSMAIAHEMVVL